MVYAFVLDRQGIMQCCHTRAILCYKEKIGPFLLFSYLKKKSFSAVFFFLHYCCGFIFSLLLPSSSHFIFIVICTVLDVYFCSA